MKKSDFELGQELYFIPGETRNKPYTAKIEKIENKLLHCNRYSFGRPDTKIDFETMNTVTDYGFRDKVYLSEAHYIQEQEDLKLYTTVKNLIPRDREKLLKILEIINESI